MHFLVVFGQLRETDSGLTFTPAPAWMCSVLCCILCLHLLGRFSCHFVFQVHSSAPSIAANHALQNMDILQQSDTRKWEFVSLSLLMVLFFDILERRTWQHISFQSDPRMTETHQTDHFTFFKHNVSDTSHVDHNVPSWFFDILL